PPPLRSTLFPYTTLFRSRALFGHYEVDSDGVVPKTLSLVEKGILKTFLLTRQPMRGFNGSNGRARLPGGFGANNAAFGNLFIHRSEEHTSELQSPCNLVC